MLLALDIGNTAVSWGLFEGPALRASGRCRTARQIHSALATLPKSEAVIAATAAPRRAERILQWTHQATGRRPLLAARDFAIPIENLTRAPERVGHDRLLAALAAYARTNAATIVVDAGTAITVDYVDARGRFQGGAILPGPLIAARALHRYTEALPRVEVEKPCALVGRDTEEAMRSGVYWGTVGAVEGMIARLRREAGAAPVLITGGDGEWLAAEIGLADRFQPHLTLEGLRLAYERPGRASAE
jgi:type III pantothenate kinase